MDSNETSRELSVPSEKDQVTQQTLKAFHETKVAMAKLPVHDSDMV